MNIILKEENIASLIYFIRGEKIMLDSDLADLYGVETRVLNQSVKRNIDRFPSDFMFQLNEIEFENLRSQFVMSPGKMNDNSSQFVMSSRKHRGIKYLNSGIHRARCSYAFRGIEQQKSYRSECCHHAYICAGKKTASR